MPFGTPLLILSLFEGRTFPCAEARSLCATCFHRVVSLSFPPAGFPLSQLDGFLKFWLRSVEEEGPGALPQLMWREATAQHFEGPRGGNYVPNNNSGVCTQVDFGCGGARGVHIHTQPQHCKTGVSATGADINRLLLLFRPRRRRNAEDAEFRNSVARPLLEAAGVPILSVWAATARLGATQARTGSPPLPLALTERAPPLHEWRGFVCVRWESVA